MQFSELRKRDHSARGVTIFRGDESLVPDSRCGMRPVDCIERKLGTLLTDDAAMAPDEVLPASAVRSAARF
jgi:hypothetical protein